MTHPTPTPAPLAALAPKRGVYQCTACGCVWRHGEGGTWSLANSAQNACKRCDNSPEFLGLMELIGLDPTLLMDWQQKAAALDALKAIEIRIRKPGDWYVHHGVEIKDNGLLCGDYGNGKTPEDAILDHWERLVTAIEQTPKYLVVNAMTERRRAVRWNGYMWQDVPEPKTSES